MFTDWNLRDVVTRKRSRKWFDSDRLKLERNYDHGNFIILRDKILGMMSNYWKYSKFLQIVTNVTNPGLQIITHRKGK